MAKNSRAISIPAADREWRGRDAARTLAEAEKIKADPTLSKLAAEHAGKLATERMQEAVAMQKVAKSVAPKVSASKPSPKPVAKKTTKAPVTKKTGKK